MSATRHRRFSTPPVPPSMRPALLPSIAPILLALLVVPAAAQVREWRFPAVEKPVEAEFVTESKGYVVLRGANGTSFELPLANFSKADRHYIRIRTTEPAQPGPLQDPGKPVTTRSGYRQEENEDAGGRLIAPPAASEIHVSGDAASDPLAGSTIHFEHADGWLFLERIKPSVVLREHLGRILVNHAPAEPGVNLRVVAHAHGAVVIPHGPDHPALVLHDAPGLAGKSTALKCHVAYAGESLDATARGARSLVLKRGYMATLAANDNGTGVSRNYVAQDHDVVIRELPEGLDGRVGFVRVFPWRWTSKKGIAALDPAKLDAGWHYNWNLNQNSTPDIEYVPIKQKRWWPGLDQDWKARGSLHLLGYNEPDRPDQANMSVDEAIQGWPELQATGLRLGSPAPSDGGLGWLYEFMDRADREGLRVDFVAVHYYRAVADPGNERAAADQFRNFLRGIHERTRRPIWITEWNNGANWTKAPDPNDKQQRAAIQAMIEMLDETPWVERYAPYNWVEPCRELVRDGGSLSPAGEAFRDQRSPVFFQQPSY